MKLLANNKVDTNLYELQIRVDGDEYKAALEKSYIKNSKKLNVPGFRKGKAPKAMVMKLVGEEYFYDDAINTTYQDAYTAALDESGLIPVDRADVELGDIDSEGYTFTAKITVKPEVTIDGYKGLAVTRTAAAVEDAEVDEELGRMAERNSRLVDIDDRPAQNGDTANIDFEGMVDGVAFEGGKGKDYDLVLGSGQFIPGFEEQIVGKSIGESFDVNVNFPEEYHAEELKGKAAVFKVTLNSLKLKELPSMDDEFAKDVSEFETLEALRGDIKDKLLERKQKQSDEMLENELCEAAAAKMTAEIPQVMIDRKLDEMINDFGYRLQSQGMNLEDYLRFTGSSVDAMRTQMAPQAEQQVKVTLALEKIAELENLNPSDEDVAAEYDKAAKAYNIEIDKVKTFISEESIISSLRLNRAVDLIKESAVITEEGAKPHKAAKKTASKAADEEKPAKAAKAAKTAKTAAPKAEKAEAAEKASKAKKAAPKAKKTENE